MDFLSYIDPKLLILVPVLYAAGEFIKKGQLFKDKHIPLILCASGVALSVLWMMSATDLLSWQSVLSATFTAIVQGVLCAGTAVFTNQVVKQSGKDE